MLYFYIAGACALGSVLTIMALSRQRRLTYEEHRRALEDRIQASEDSIREDALRMPAQEHLRVARAAVEEMLRLDASGEAWTLDSAALWLCLRAGEKEWRLEAEDLRQRELRHRGRVICAPAGWRLCEMQGGSSLSMQSFPHMDAAVAALRARLFPALGKNFLPPTVDGRHAGCTYGSDSAYAACPQKL